MTTNPGTAPANPDPLHGVSSSPCPKSTFHTATRTSLPSHNTKIPFSRGCSCLTLPSAGRNSSVDPPRPPASREKGTAHTVSRHSPILAQSPSAEPPTAEFALNKLQLSLERSVTSHTELCVPVQPHPTQLQAALTDTGCDPPATLGLPGGDKSSWKHMELWEGDHKAQGL